MLNTALQHSIPFTKYLPHRQLLLTWKESLALSSIPSLHIILTSPETMAVNQAAWLDGANKPLVVRDANMPQLGPDEILVRNSAVAINPVDWKVQNGFYLDQLEMPFILGTDIAGVVHEVGSAVKNFKKGDRVLA